MIVVFTIFTGVTIYLIYYNWSFINSNNNNNNNNIYCIKYNNRKKNKNLMSAII